MKRRGKIHIGTSGWNYRHWVGNFYPEHINSHDELAYYSARFSTVEVNNSFYRWPGTETFTAWKTAVPKDFVFSVKANRYITHMKKLIVDRASVEELFDRSHVLGKKCGPILFQLPPNWKVNLERLETFLAALPPRRHCTFEFRHPSWHCTEVFELLQLHNAAFCIFDIAGFRSPIQVTTDFAYIRLHGPGGKYQGSYSKTALNDWAKTCLEWAQDGIDVFIYFDNDQFGYAAANALMLQTILQKHK